MITKAYIQEVLSPHSVKIRIPILNKIEDVNGATPNTELPVAAICTLPNIIAEAHAGDVVIVGFEENDTSHPLVLGHLSTYKESNSLVDATIRNLEVKESTILSEDTHIGEITPENIECLKNQKENINTTFQTINIAINEIKNDITTNASNIGAINDIITDSTTGIGALNEIVANLDSRLDKVESDINDLKKSLDDYVKKFPAVFTGSYGNSTSNVTSPENGQIYFKLNGDN